MAKKFIKILILLFVIVVVSIIIYFFVGRKEKVEYVTAKVERGRLIQTVSETGTVKAASEIDLNFLNNGQLAKVLVKVGDKVKKGQILAELDYSRLIIKEKEAQANLEIAKANLSKLLKGATEEEIAVARANVDQAEAAYLAAVRELEKTENTVAENIAQAEKTLNDLESDTSDDITTYEQAVDTARANLNNVKSTYKQSVDNKENIVLTTLESELADGNTALDTINTIITDTDAQDILSVKNTSHLTNTKNAYSQGVSLLAVANNSLLTAKSEKKEADIDKAIDDALVALNKIFESLNFCFDALEASITSSSFTQTDLDAAKSNISTELTNISVSISAIQTAQQNLTDARLAYETNVSDAEENLAQARANFNNALINAQNALNTARFSGEEKIAAAEAKVDNAREAWEVAKAKLAQIKAPARSEDVALRRAQVAQAQAALEQVRKQIEDSIIKSPIDGRITAVNYEVGEQTSAGEPVISMLGVNNFEIEVDISEVDIAKVSVGNPTEITLDAFGDDVKFSGKVYFIEPAETIIQDVIYYKVKIEFVEDANMRRHAQNIKSGMTANAVIVTAQKDNVLIMPSRAVVQKNGGKYARVLANGAVREMPIKTGLRGDEGMVEVLSGIKEGDEVVTFVKSEK
jgi:HlyD family secretion protein